MSDFNWALANMQATYKPADTKWVYEAEAKGKREHVGISSSLIPSLADSRIQGDLNGLAALLLDDSGEWIDDTILKPPLTL